MAARAFFRIEGQDATAAAWNSALGRANSAATQMKGFFTTAFAGISAVSIINVGKEIIQLGDDLEKTRIRAKLTAEEVSTLAYASKQADIELGSLTMALQKMQIYLSKAAEGQKENVEGLDAIGLSLQDLEGLNAAERFELIAEQVSKLRKEEDQTRAVTEIFGKAGGDLLPMFEQGATGIRKAREEAEKLGYAFSEEQLQSLSAADDAIKRLDSSWQAFAVTLTAKVGPPLARVLDDASSGAMLERFKKLGISPIYGIYSAGQEVFGGPDSEGAAGRGVAGRRGGDRGMGSLLDAPPGFRPDTTAADKAAAKAEEARIDAMVAAQAEFTAELWRTQEANVAFNRGLEDNVELADRWLEDGMDALGSRLEDLPIETWGDTFKVMADDFATAVGNMAADGRAEWDSMLRYWGMQLLQSGIRELIANIFANSSGDAGGGMWSAVGGFVSSLFGGSRDSGGRGRPGQVYAIGRGAQPELFVPDSAGTFIPNAGREETKSSPISISNTYNISTSSDDPKALQRMLKEHDRQLFQLLDRVYGISPR